MVKNNIVGLFMLLSLCQIISQSVYNDGYFRKDGTYVRPYFRSYPDKKRWNNFGPSITFSDRISPYQRDFDLDGTPNWVDFDDDNDGWLDDFDRNQYGAD
ncbi:MAG: hypothetical protein NZT61_07780 [Deltaproteobacteria bacterium]|nr:hypothetical protein [Deltaproteobacteria bacterium]